ncbi:hypothetical protein [Janibacter anophelis]|uniref:hypothetical protein n=1 Tax=Janibacter anophelis TaxID=319054 RepID=UPI00082ACBBE|nr:hypothetical protein [Janibacter anophelis]
MGFVLVVAVVLSLMGAYAFREHLWGPRADARAAARALQGGDLAAAHEHLVAHRGSAEFAYYFATEVTPRDLGDGLASVAGDSEDRPFAPGVDPAKFELVLTDVAGALALATHGTGPRALPEQWTSDFITAMTRPTQLYGAHDGFFDFEGKKRERQDTANRSNLLLVLSRGYWSDGFLQDVTRGFHDFDRAEGEDAWPDAEPDDDIGYTPAPSGAYLTDGIVALMAALTANSSASEWAFTQFLPGTMKVEGANYSLGRFAHFVLFEHSFPRGEGGESVGVTTALTALSSAVVSDRGNMSTDDTPPDAKVPSPARDAAVVHALAESVVQRDRCTKHPGTYVQCLKAAGQAVWRVVQTWGHTALDLLTFASFVPMPFMAIGATAIAVNATWYAIEGDYVEAGVSLRAAVPGKGAVRAVKHAKRMLAGDKQDEVPLQMNGEDWAAEMDAATTWRPRPPWNDCDLVPEDGLRLRFRSLWSDEQRSIARAEVRQINEAATRGEVTASSPRLLELEVQDIRVQVSLQGQIDNQLEGVDPGRTVSSAAIC